MRQGCPIGRLPSILCLPSPWGRWDCTAALTPWRRGRWEDGILPREGRPHLQSFEKRREEVARATRPTLVVSSPRTSRCRWSGWGNDRLPTLHAHHMSTPNLSVMIVVDKHARWAIIGLWTVRHPVRRDGRGRKKKENLPMNRVDVKKWTSSAMRRHGTCSSSRKQRPTCGRFYLVAWRISLSTVAAVTCEPQVVPSLAAVPARQNTRIPGCDPVKRPWHAETKYWEWR